MECDRDPMGGIYFQTDKGGWHILTTESHGFVYQPNERESRRFGRDSYQYESVGGEWYWFKASQPFDL
jgi:hypothetical protein